MRWQTDELKIPSCRTYRQEPHWEDREDERSAEPWRVVEICPETAAFRQVISSSDFVFCLY
jgi:hypothetical protein